jgi:NTP pyrophosphatase (non-canonical NTP hydrolase)
MSESPAMRSDSNTTVQYLRQLLRKFRDERDWEQFHDPKSLAEAISIESSELLELFLWKSAADIKEAMESDQRFRKVVEAELADVFCFGFNLANAANIDVSNAIIRKIETNNKKYPIKKSKGTATKYDKL